MTAVSNQSIDNRVDTVTYHRIPGTTTTVCAIKMVNGFVVLGQSACVDPGDFNQEVGESIAHDNAREKIWPLEGYLAAERRHAEACNDGSLSIGQDVEIFSTVDKIRWLFSLPLSHFSRFGIMIVTECWYALDGVPDNAPSLSPGMQQCINGVFDILARKEKA